MSATVSQTRRLGDGLGVEIGGVDLKHVGDTPIAGFIDCHDRASALQIWDNGATLRRGDPFDASARRLVHRTQVG